MPDHFVVDTHALIWFLQADIDRLGLRAREVLAAVENNLIIPAIVLAEASHIIMRGRTNIPTPEILVRAINLDSRFSIAAIDKEIVERSFALTNIKELHDRLIVATAIDLIEKGTPVSLISKDANIRDSGTIPVIW